MIYLLCLWLLPVSIGSVSARIVPELLGRALNRTVEVCLSERFGVDYDAVNRFSSFLSGQRV